MDGCNLICSITIDTIFNFKYIKSFVPNSAENRFSLSKIFVAYAYKLNSHPYPTFPIPHQQPWPTHCAKDICVFFFYIFLFEFSVESFYTRRFRILCSSLSNDNDTAAAAAAAATSVGTDISPDRCVV